MISAPPLSVLDLATVSAHASTTEALRNTTRLAQRAEQLGYRRFWVAEHHNMPGIASSAPAVLIAHLAANTSAIRVGSGGVMLPNHSPLVVAEQFGMLESLHPGRIDLGVGRAPGTDQRTALALRRTPEGLSAENFPDEFLDVVRMLAGDARLLRAMPTAEGMPEIWLLGSSDFSARLAGLVGLPFCFAHHFSSANTDVALAAYRSSFQPSQWLDAPHVMICASVTCAPTSQEAARLARPGWISFLSMRSGRPVAMPSVEEAAEREFSEFEEAFIAERRRGQLIGSPDEIETLLRELLARTEPNELMITNQIYDIDARIRSLELVAELAGVTAAA
ncbi:MAG: LLM class flavin-dependent oxidoreductase [Actinobacteria bacterium]|nr:LLM class flavin-dependent oxidoreductase [Actinomycetota bacterium]